MPYLVVNNSNGGTGHVDLTFVPDSGSSLTVGYNQNHVNPSAATMMSVESEDQFSSSTQTLHSQHIEVSADGFNAALAAAQHDVQSGAPDGYSLIGANCVDYVQHLFGIAGVQGYVADYLVGNNSLVSAYADAERSLGQSSAAALTLVENAGAYAADDLRNIGTAINISAIVATLLGRSAAQFDQSLEGQQPVDLGTGDGAIIVVDRNTNTGVIIPVVPSDPNSSTHLIIPDGLQIPVGTFSLTIPPQRSELSITITAPSTSSVRFPEVRSMSVTPTNMPRALPTRVVLVPYGIRRLPTNAPKPCMGWWLDDEAVDYRHSLGSFIRLRQINRLQRHAVGRRTYVFSKRRDFWESGRKYTNRSRPNTG